MFEMWDHLLFGIAAFLENPANVTLSLLSLSLATLIMVVLRDKNLEFRSRLLLIYAHLSFISFPAVLLALTLSCASLGADCPVTVARLGLLLFPASIFISMVVGSLLLPMFFSLGGRRITDYAEFITSESGKLGLRRPPALFAFDANKPTAYSVSGLGSAIFVSVGMLELFTRREVEAVLLHELNHLHRRAPLLKASDSVLRLFSPFARAMPAPFTAAEERRADAFAAERQGTRRHVESAKRKSGMFG